MTLLERTFRLSENGTTPSVDVLGGLTTFMTMSYIIFVQPAVMSTTGIGMILGVVHFHGVFATPPSPVTVALHWMIWLFTALFLVRYIAVG